MKQLIVLTVAANLGLFSMSGFSAGPFVTDDAGLTAPHSCQLEAWKKFNRKGYEETILPACNPAENIELSFGQLHTVNDLGVSERQYLIQGKTVFHPMTESVGWGLAMGATVRVQPQSEQNKTATVYAYIPASYQFGENKPAVHLNIGGLRNYDEKRSYLTWSIGSEIPLMSNLSLNIESYGDHRSNPSYQLGFTYSIVANRMELFVLTGGQQYNNQPNGRWQTIGLSIHSK